MSLLFSALNLVKKHEGFRSHPYLDTVNTITIGYGRNLEGNPLTLEEWNVVIPNGLSIEQSDRLLQNDIESVLGWLETYSWWDKLSDNRKLVLIDMGVNLGQTKFSRFVGMIKALEEGNYLLAAHEMHNSKWSHQVGQRALDDVNLMLKG